MFYVYVRNEPREVALVPVRSIERIIDVTEKKEEGRGKFLTVGARRVGEKIVVKAQVKSVEKDLVGYNKIDREPVYGLGGLFEIEQETYAILVGESDRVGREGSAMRVRKVVILSLKNDRYDRLEGEVQELDVAGGYNRAGGENVYGRKGVTDRYNRGCAEMIKLMEAGTFYFSKTGNIIDTQQDIHTMARLGKDPAFSNGRMRKTKKEYIYNNYLTKVIDQYRKGLRVEEKKQFDEYGFLIRMIKGSVEVIELGELGRVKVVSRLSSGRAGTRYLTRGLGDNGNVANESETEVIWEYGDYIVSYVIVRGSVPLFWSSEGVQIGGHRVQLTRSLDASVDATKLHFGKLLTRYGSVNIVNLLRINNSLRMDTSSTRHQTYDFWTSSCSEAELGFCYKVQMTQKIKSRMITYREYNFHNIVKGGNGAESVREMVEGMEKILNGQGMFVYNRKKDKIERVQTGVHRVNCLDCLDRTNVVQSEITRQVFGMALIAICGEFVDQELYNMFDSCIGTLFVRSGNALSKIYSGTNALKTDLTSSGMGAPTNAGAVGMSFSSTSGMGSTTGIPAKGSGSISGLTSFLSDASKSLSRFVQSNFGDKNKQEAMNILTGKGAEQSEMDMFVEAELDDAETIVEEVSEGYDIEAAGGKSKRDLLEMAKRLESKREIKVLGTTYNLHGLGCASQSELGSWLELSIDQNERPDIVMVCLQEIVELSVKEVLSSSGDNRDKWTGLILDRLNSQISLTDNNKYKLVVSAQLVGVAVILIATEDVLRLLSRVEIVKIKTGLIGGLAGNKGGVITKLNIGYNTVCIVGSHFASGATKDLERNNDYHAINSRLSALIKRSNRERTNIVWLGDLNYRVELPYQDAKALIQQNNLPSLFLYDQLSYQMLTNGIFDGFSELPIGFAPTYKFDLGTGLYDTSEKARVPSWTDRILFKNMYCHYYNAHNEVRFSDHRPVTALFTFITEYNHLYLPRNKLFDLFLSCEK